MKQLTNSNSIDRSIFKKDMLDKCKLKNAKRRFKAQQREKLTIVSSLSEIAA